MSAGRILALTLTLLATACASNGTQVSSGLTAGEDRLAADKSPAALIRIADATRAGGDAGSAIGLYQRAHEVAPKDPVPLARLGAAYTELRAYNEAAGAFRQAIQLAPKDAELRCGLGTVLLAIDKPELALTQLDAALALRPEPRTYNLLGVANDLIGRHDVAQQDYADGLRLAPDNLPLRNNLGLSLALSGAFEPAIATLNAATESPKATARTRQNLALVYGLAGDSGKAASVARTDLDDASVKSNLAYYAMLRGMDDRARAAAIIGAHAPMNGDQAAVQTPLAPSPQAATAAAPVEAVEAMPLAMLAPPATSRPKPVAQKTAPVAAAEPASATTPVTVRSTDSRPIEPAAPPAPLQTHETPTPTAPSPVASAATAAADAPSPENHATLQIAAVAPQPTPPVESASTPGAATTAVDAARPDEPAPQIATAPQSPPPTEPAPPPVASAAPDAAEPPAGTQSAPQLVAALPQATPPDAAAQATDAPRTQADPASVPARGTTVKRHGFLVQVGAFRDATKAQKLCRDLVAKGYDFSVSEAHGDASHDWFFCRSSGVADHAEAAAMAQRLSAKENTAALLIPASASP
jgi:Flp pilus assembly protein TadD